MTARTVGLVVVVAFVWAFIGAFVVTAATR